MLVAKVPKKWTPEQKCKEMMKPMDCPDNFCYYLDILWTVQTISRLSGLFGQFLDYPECLWIVRTVSRLSIQSLDCTNSFKIIWTFSGLSGKFIDYRNSLWIIQTVYQSSRQFLCKPDGFLAKKLDFCKDFPYSNGTMLPCFFWLWMWGKLYCSYI